MPFIVTSVTSVSIKRYRLLGRINKSKALIRRLHATSFEILKNVQDPSIAGNKCVERDRILKFVEPVCGHVSLILGLRLTYCSSRALSHFTVFQKYPSSLSPQSILSWTVNSVDFKTEFTIRAYNCMTMSQSLSH